MDLKVDPKRQHLPETGIFVRTKIGEKYESVDIAHLDLGSLMTWLRSRGGNNIWAENTVAILLGHGLPEPAPEKERSE
jgi:hypothetical protein